MQQIVVRLMIVREVLKVKLSRLRECKFRGRGSAEESQFHGEEVPWGFLFNH